MNKEEIVYKKLERVRRLINQSGETYYKIAKNNSMSPQTIKRIEDGTTVDPNERTLDTLIAYFTPEETSSSSTPLRLSQFSDDTIIEYMIDNEERFKQKKLFKLWLKQQINEGIIASLKNDLKQ